MIARNPEFVRNLWLELTPLRLLTMPLLLALIFVIDANTGSPHPASYTALTLFLLLTVAWGGKLAADSLIAEYAQGTWDSQRLSGLSAGQMTAGKLFGGPAFAWYGGAICLIVHAVATRAPVAVTLRTLFSAVALAISVHALCLLATLLAARRLHKPAPPRGLALLILLILVPWVFGLARNEAALSDEPVRWYGHAWATLDFTAFSLALLLGWSVTGLYRMLREELAFRDPPLAWLGFVLCGWIYIGGFIWPDGPKPLTLHLSIAALFTGALSYVLLFIERKDWLRLRRLLAAMQQTPPDLPRAAALLPLWLCSAALTVAVALLLILPTLLLPISAQPLRELAVLLGWLLCFGRDLALVLALHFGKDTRRADGAALLYLAVLYGLLPVLFHAMDLPQLVPLLVPHTLSEAPWMLALVLPQPLAAGWWAWRRWQRLPR